MPELSHLIGTLEPLVREHGALAVTVILTLESFGAPVPGESLLVFASALSACGELSTLALALAAWSGAVMGDNIGYAIGHFAGRALLLRYGVRLGLTAERMDRVEAAFKRFGPAAVGLARFVAVLRQLNGVVAGTLAMDWRHFLLFNALGAALWVALWITIGHTVGEHAEGLLGFGRRYWPVIAIVAGLVLVGAAVWRVRARAARRGAG